MCLNRVFILSTSSRYSQSALCPLMEAPPEPDAAPVVNPIIDEPFENSNTNGLDVLLTNWDFSAGE